MDKNVTPWFYINKAEKVSDLLALPHYIKNIYSPRKNDSLVNIVSVAAGKDHSLFIDIDNNFWCCGNNTYG